MFCACCVVPILAQGETVVQPLDTFLAVFPMIMGAFFAIYTKIPKLFPCHWRGNTKVFNIFSTVGGHLQASAAFFIPRTAS
jgi:uncharacterized membrane protein